MRDEELESAWRRRGQAATATLGDMSEQPRPPYPPQNPPQPAAAQAPYPYPGYAPYAYPYGAPAPRRSGWIWVAVIAAFVVAGLGLMMIFASVMFGRMAG